MSRQRATVTLDRKKVDTATKLVRARTISETLDIALDRLIRSERLRRDIAAYARVPQGAEELGIADLDVELDLDDGDVDYEALFGAP